MNTGTVKWYNETKGFGFIINDDKKEIFVHKTGLKNLRKLDQDQKVRFDITDGQKGPTAINVEIIK